MGVIGIPVGKKRRGVVGKGTEKVFEEIMSRISPNFIKTRHTDSRSKLNKE